MSAGQVIAIVEKGPVMHEVRAPSDARVSGVLVRDGVIAIGDASGMIDPFTGTGIQMALRTGEMVAEAIVQVMGSVRSVAFGEDEVAGGQRRSSVLDSVLARYAREYEREFYNRMRVAGLLRAAAFSPPTASIVATVLARMPRLTNLVLRATRGGNGSRNAID